MKSLEGKNVLLTGASRGIGVVIAQFLVSEGANLCISSRMGSSELLENVARGLKTHNVKIETTYGDVSIDEDRKRIVEDCVSKLGSIDVLINNAGIEYTAPFQKTDPQLVRSMVNINLVAPIELSRLVLPKMEKNKYGRIVNIASLAGRVPLIYNSIYSATKSGLITWTKTVNDEFRGTGVYFSAVCPGFISDVGMHAVRNLKAPTVAKEVTPEKVAKMVVKAIHSKKTEFLVSASPIRPLLGLWEWFPGIKNLVYNSTGLGKFMKEVNDFEMSRRK